MIIERVERPSQPPWEFVKITTREALSIIESLISQMKAGNPNDGRLESRVQGAFGPASEGGYMTIMITELEEFEHGPRS